MESGDFDTVFKFAAPFEIAMVGCKPDGEGYGNRCVKEHPDRFIPRYSMVMFHLLPYAEAYRRGKLQAAILDELTAQAVSLDEVDYDRAARLIADMD